MVTMVQTPADGDVPTKLEFVLPTSHINVRVVAHGAEANTGTHEEKDVVIHDARIDPQNYTLDTSGFELVDHPTNMENWHDKEEIERVYYEEIKEMLKRVLGADEVSCFHHFLRRTDAKPGTEYQPPGIGAHIDFAPHWAAKVAEKHLPREGYEYSRFICVNVWRALSTPPQDWPLAVCDGRSVPPDAGVFNALVYMENLPEMSEIKAIEPPNPGGTIFRYDPRLKWCYYSGMKKDEALCFKLFDSERKEGWRVPHAAFFNTVRKDANPRESVEIRTVCYFK